ncbi:MAG: excinuclease subunit, partial [Conexibacter sp.]|nr:excinuclease subunit [Conexibacter sp.]
VHALRVAYVQRRDLEGLPQEWNQPGVYVLLTDDGSGEIYVGQAVGLRGRLFQHRSKPKLAWRRAVVIKRDTSHGFNSAEIGYLEGRLASELGALPGLAVIEGLKSQDMTLPSHHMLALDALLPSVLAALRMAGLDLFKEEPTGEDDPPASNAHGPGAKKTHTVVAGSVSDLVAVGLLRAGAELYFTRAGKQATAKVTAAGELVVAGVAYSSPSSAAAAAFSLKAANGWVSWRVGDATGPTLADLRSQLADKEPQS